MSLHGTWRALAPGEHSSAILFISAVEERLDGLVEALSLDANFVLGALPSDALDACRLLRFHVVLVLGDVEDATLEEQLERAGVEHHVVCRLDVIDPRIARIATARMRDRQRLLPACRHFTQEA
jgi:hypothetical protein